MQKIFLKDDKTLKRFNHINVFVGEENADELQILIPQEGYNGIDLSNCQIKLTYITPDEIENSFLINEFKQTELYKNYYVYSILIDKYFTYKNGRILLYLTFIDTVNDIDIVLKTDETYLDIKNHHSGSNEPSQAELDIIDQVTLISNSALQNSEQAISLVNWIKEKIENGDFDGEDGYSPTIEEYSTETEYRLIIHNKDSDFESPNLKPDNDYEHLRHLPKVNNVEFTGNKTSQDLGLTSSSEFNGLSEIVNVLSDNLDENYYTKDNVNNIEENLTNSINGLRDNVLTKTNTTPYTPSSIYNPSTKKYVDDNKNDILQNINLYFAKKTDLNTKQDTLTAGAGIVINNNIISADAGIKILVVQELPSVDIDTKAIYFLPKIDSEINNVYDKYMYINSAWELIGNKETASITGVPQTTSSLRKLYSKGQLLLSDNGKIYLCTNVISSGTPPTYTYSWRVYQSVPSTTSADAGKIFRVNAQGQAEWQTVASAESEAY